MAIPARSVRVEFVDFQNVGAHREYRFRICGSEEPTEVRLRVAIDGFVTGGVRMQDGPDVCYQRLLREVAAGETAVPELITLDDADLVSYRVAHTPVARHRTYTPAASAPAANLPPKPQRTFVRTPSPRLPVVPPASKAAPAFEAGQRVSHAVFGVGVTSSSSDGHTVVHFDQNGSKTFVTALLEVDVLSAAHTWETGPRGINRACAKR